MKLVAYIRVSTKEQVENGQGLAIQEQDVRAWAKANGHKLVAVYRDEGISGSNGVDTRHGLYSALSDIAKGRAEGLLLPKLDRLAREFTVQESTLAQVWKHGGTVFTVDTGEVPADDPSDPMRTAMRQMMGVFAQLERGMIRARMSAGQKAKAATGGYAGGAPRYGVAAVNGSLVSDPAESEAVARMTTMRKQGMSLRAIAAELDAVGIKPKRGARWSAQSVANVLKTSSVP